MKASVAIPGIKGNTMKHAATTKNRASHAILLLGITTFLLATVSSSVAAPADVYLKKDGFPIQFWAWMGGAAGSEAPLYMYVEYAPTTVMKEHKDGTLWIHDCDNSAIVTIGYGEWGSLPTDIVYQGTGSITLQGLWTFDPETGWFLPSEERMNWHVMGSVFDADGNEWKLHWQLVRRNGEVNETYRFEPLN
jgi:hypothetical protein